MIFACVLATPVLILALLAGLMVMRMTQPASVAGQPPLPSLVPLAALQATTAAPPATLGAQVGNALPTPSPTSLSLASAPLSNSTDQPTPPASPVATNSTSGNEPATAIPQSSPTPPAIATSNSTPTLAASTATSAPTLTPPALTLTPAATATPSDWTFANVRVMPHPSQNGLLVVGEIVNNTGAPQTVLEVSGSFYNVQGQLVAGPLKTSAEIPTDKVPIPAGGRMPFAMHVQDIEQAETYSLQVKAQASAQTATQFDTFVNSTPVTVRGKYCINSTLPRPEPGLTTYLAVSLLLLDGEGRALSLGDVYEPDVSDVMSSPTHNFQICADAHNEVVGGYVLRAWGR